MDKIRPWLISSSPLASSSLPYHQTTARYKKCDFVRGWNTFFDAAHLRGGPQDPHLHKTTTPVSKSWPRVSKTKGFCYFLRGAREAPKRHPRGTQEAFKRHPRREVSKRPPRGPQEAPRRPKRRVKMQKLLDVSRLFATFAPSFFIVFIMVLHIFSK